MEIINKLFFSVIVLSVLLISADSNAKSLRKFIDFDKQVVSESINWVNAPDSMRLTAGQSAVLKKMILASNFHASLGSSVFGTMHDFVTAMARIAPLSGIGIEISKFQKSVTPPYSLSKPLISCNAVLTIAYKPHGNKKMAYQFKFLFYSDTDRLQDMAKKNGFPKSELIDKKTSLIMIKEMLTENYPDGFMPMTPESFNIMLSTPLEMVNDYIDLRK